MAHDDHAADGADTHVDLRNPLMLVLSVVLLLIGGQDVYGGRTHHAAWSPHAATRPVS